MEIWITRLRDLLSCPEIAGDVPLAGIDRQTRGELSALAARERLPAVPEGKTPARSTAVTGLADSAGFERRIM